MVCGFRIWYRPMFFCVHQLTLAPYCVKTNRSCVLMLSLHPWDLDNEK